MLYLRRFCRFVRRSCQSLALAQIVALTVAGTLPGTASASPESAAPPSPGASAPKVLRYAFPIAETGFDPARISDLYSSTIVSHMIESLYTFDYLERPVRLRTLTAAALPESNASFTEFTVKVQPGIYFADDPAFGGKRRELVAADYVYSIKRHFDPRNNSPRYGDLLEELILGLNELHDQAVASKKPFDYDTPIPGLQALDRYTLRVRLGKPNPRFGQVLAIPAVTGAVAREVVEHYVDAIMAHPVGTGPFVLTQWRRSSLIVLSRNPGFRDQRFDSQPGPDDPEGQAIAKALGGRRLPMVDRMEFAIIEAAQPMWLSFLAGDFDLVSVPFEFAPQAAPGGKLAPHLAKRGIGLQHVLRADVAFTYFNMEDPVVGGYTPDKVALRRAIALAYDNATEIRQARKGLAITAQGLVAPYTFGYDGHWRSGMSEFDPARARALLDLYGYLDRDGDGWREQPDGSPLVLEYHTQGDNSSRHFNELWRKFMADVGLKMEFLVAQWPEQLKRAEAGKLMIWGMGSSATAPDGQDALGLAYGPRKGATNLCRFDLPAYNRIYDRINVLPDGPERAQLFNEAQRLLVAYMPIKSHVHRVRMVLTQPWLKGYREHPFTRDFGRYVDVEH